MTDQNWQIGQIKFFDKDKGFGFVKNLINGQDYFVHITKIRTLPIQDNDRVVFKLFPSTSKKKQGTFEAYNVTLLAQFKSDNDFLIQQFSQLKDVLFKKAILKGLPVSCVTYLIEQELTLQKIISNDIEYKNFTNKIYSISKLFEDSISKDTFNDLISKHVEDITSDDYRVQLWLDKIIKLEPQLNLVRKYFIVQQRVTQELIYLNLSNEARKLLFESFIMKNNFSGSFKNLIIFLKFEKQIDVQKQFVFLISERLETKKTNLEESKKGYELLLSSVKEFDKSVSELLVAFLYSVSSDYIKLKLWLSDLIDKEDYDIYQSNFIFLTTSDQQRFIKKLFYLLSQNANGITYERIFALKGLTFTFSEGKKFQLDFSCNIILASIESIKSGFF